MRYSGYLTSVFESVVITHSQIREVYDALVPLFSSPTTGSTV